MLFYQDSLGHSPPGSRNPQGPQSQTKDCRSLGKRAWSPSQGQHYGAQAPGSVQGVGPGQEVGELGHPSRCRQETQAFPAPRTPERQSWLLL